MAGLPALPLFANAPDGFEPCKIHQRVRVNFPVRPLHQGITRGEVSLFLEVDRDGQLRDVLVFRHTGKDFAEAALDAIKRWRFTPAAVFGEPIGSINQINVHFEVSGVIAYTKLIGQNDELLAFGDRVDYRPFTLVELDGVPRGISRPSPIYPREWIKQGRKGTVSVEYFIDETGHARFPRKVGDADELLAATTLAAVKTWRFEPPLRQGQPVLARVTQEFHFRPDISGR
jgi:TonB family protein